MKLLIPFLLIANMATAQEAPRKCNTIYVKGVTFAQVQQVLADNGYFVDKKDNEVQTLITVPEALDKTPVKVFGNNFKRLTKVFFNIRVKDSIATVTGKYNYEVLDKTNYSPISNIGMKGSVDNISWSAMNDICLKIGTVVYTKD